MKLVDPDFSQRRVSRVHEDSAGLRDQEKLSLQQIGDRFDRSACRAAQIYQAARHKIQFPPNGLSYRVNHILKYAGIPATKEAVLKSLKDGSLTPTKRPIGYGKMTHAELCRWVGVTPHLFRKRKKLANQ